MAVVTETAADMTDAAVETGTEQRYMVLGPADERVLAIAVDPQNPTLAERIFVRSGFVVKRSDGSPGGMRWSEWKNYSTTNYATLDSAGGRVAMKVVHDKDRIEVDLD